MGEVSLNCQRRKAGAPGTSGPEGFGTRITGIGDLNCPWEHCAFHCPPTCVSRMSGWRRRVDSWVTIRKGDCMAYSSRRVANTLSDFSFLQASTNSCSPVSSLQMIVDTWPEPREGFDAFP